MLLILQFFESLLELPLRVLVLLKDVIEVVKASLHCRRSSIVSVDPQTSQPILVHSHLVFLSKESSFAIATVLWQEPTLAVLAAEQAVSFIVDQICLGYEAIMRDVVLSGELRTSPLKVKPDIDTGLLHVVLSNNAQCQHSDCKQVERAVIHAAQSSLLIESTQDGQACQEVQQRET